MLFHIQWEFTDTSESSVRRSLAVFAKWQPPHDAEIKGFYGFADGSGGVMIADIPSAETLATMTAPWAPWLTFSVTPILPIGESSTISTNAISFRESVA